MNKTYGFTLIEVMVALAVFAILSAITSQALYHAFDTRARINEQANQLNAVQLAMVLIRRDTEQVIERSIRGNEMHLFPPFIGQPRYLEFSRGGFVNPTSVERHSTLTRIAFICTGKKLVRRSWDNVDTPNRKLYHDKILLNNLEKCSFAYLSNARQILSEWREYAVQQDQKKETLPLAIQLSLTIHQWGNMNLLFDIPTALYAN